MGYLWVLFAVIALLPLVLASRRRSASAGEGEKPIGKAVMVTQPSADEPTPAASSVQKDSEHAQRHTPPA
jgi:hypothetical protein